MSRFIHIAGSFAIVLVAYWAYALVAVPLIEPSDKGRNTIVDTGHHPIMPPVTLTKDWYPLFKPDAWERKDPKMLESDQFKIVMQEYTNLGNGRVKINPCTIIYTPEGSDDPVERNQRSIVLEVPDGALLQFDQDFDLSKLKIGRFIGGEFHGPVTIRSEGKLPDNQDRLLVTTHDVQMSEFDITTPNVVDFHWGPHFGRGKEMHMHMLPREGGAISGRPGSNIGGLEYFELQSVERLHLDLTKAKAPTASAAGATAAATPAPPSLGGGLPGTGSASMAGMPLEITCRGPFRFDVVQQLATFEDHVEVQRVRPVGPVDQLNCQLLSIFFTKRVHPNAVAGKNDAASGKNDGGAFDLQPQRIEATGEPVVLVAPADNVTARGERLQYEFQTAKVSLSGTQEVFLQQGPNEIHARSVQYTSAAPGHLGRVVALGPGWLRGQMGKTPDQQMEARWREYLLVRPYEQNQVISLTGGAGLKFQGINQLDAAEIHFWLWELPQPQSTQTKLEPDRMLALGNVKIESPQFSAAPERLEIWFKQLPSTTGAAAGGGIASMLPQPRSQPQPQSQPQPGPAAGAVNDRNWVAEGASPPATVQPPPPQNTAAAPARQQHLEILGRLLRAKVLMQDGRNELAELTVEDGVRFSETQTVDPTQQPLLITGSRLKVTEANKPNSIVRVVGQPAHFEGRGMSLTGSNINVDRGEDHLWVDGPGTMVVPMNHDMNGKQLATSHPLQVDWRHKMNFDGIMARFEQSVVASGPTERLRCDVMNVRLQRPIHFAQAKTEGKMDQQAQVEQIDCTGGVSMESYTLDDRRQLQSQERMEVGTLSINARTGALGANGPGWIISVRRGAVDLMGGQGVAGLGGPAGVQTVALPAGGVRTPSASDAAKADQLNCMHLRFQGNVTGNIHQHSATFHDRVRAAYAPVDSWMARLDSDDPRDLGPQGMVLHSEELAVNDMSATNSNVRAMEFVATGNAVVEGGIFTARASRISYSESKDLLIMEGDGRTDAELFRQQGAGRTAEKAAARKIFYWPKSKRSYIDGARSLDALEFNQTPGNNARKPPKGF